MTDLTVTMNKPCRKRLDKQSRFFHTYFCFRSKNCRLQSFENLTKTKLWEFCMLKLDCLIFRSTISYRLLCQNTTGHLWTKSIWHLKVGTGVRLNSKVRCFIFALECSQTYIIIVLMTVSNLTGANRSIFHENGKWNMQSYE